MTRTLAIAAVVLLVAVGCATDEDAIAEAVAEALATAPAPTTTAQPSEQADEMQDAELLRECHEMLTASEELAAEAFHRSFPVVEAVDEMLAPASADGEESDSLRQFGRSLAIWAPAVRAHLRHDSQMVARCSDVSDAGLRTEITAKGDGLDDSARSHRELIQQCHDLSTALERVTEALAIDCPDVPSMSELLPGAR